MLSVFLTFAGICLCINGVRLYYTDVAAAGAFINEKDAAVANLFTGALGLAVIYSLLNTPDVTLGNYSGAAYIGLFALTYTWVGINAFTGSDGRALGWFSLLVSLIAVPTALSTYFTAQSAFDYWLSISWLSWAVLWFMFFLLLVKQQKIARLTGMVSMIQGVATALMPALFTFWKVLS